VLVPLLIHVMMMLLPLLLLLLLLLLLKLVHVPATAPPPPSSSLSVSPRPSPHHPRLFISSVARPAASATPSTQAPAPVKSQILNFSKEGGQDNKYMRGIVFL